MDLDPISLLKSKVVPLFQNELAKLDSEIGICEIFGTKEQVYCWEDSYGVHYSYSDAAKVFTIGSYDVIGLNQGTWTAPKSAMRFMDYKGAFMIVPVDNAPPELWCSGNYYKKLSPKTPFETKELAGNAAYLELIEDRRSMLVIEVSIRKELYLKNLMIGDEDHLVLATLSGCVIVPRKGWGDFKSAYLLLPKPKKTEALILLRSLTSGSLQSANPRVQKFFAEYKDFASISQQALPSNPHARMIWLAALGAAV